MTKHEDSHAEVLRQLVIGEITVEDPRAASLLATSREFREKWEAFADLERVLHSIGAEDTDAVEVAAGDVHEEDRALATKFMASLPNATEANATPWRRNGWLLAAVAILGIALAWGMNRGESGSSHPVLMGTTLECVAPIGDGAEFGEFRWSGGEEPTAGAAFRVEVWRRGERDRSDPLVISRRLVERSWRPNAVQRSRFPDSISWRVVLIDATGAESDDAVGEARR